MAILCGKNYTLHLVGCPRTSEQLEDIPRPRAELGTHITAKFVQAFGILGTGIGAGVAKYKQDENIGDRAVKFGLNGATAGLVVGPIISAAFMRSKSTDSIRDRAYRLRMNKGQVRTDRLSLVGSLIGLGVAQYTGAMLEKGALLGMVSGCVFAGVLNTVC